ncbi:hypothetical protein [Streptomyces spiralis]
MQLLPAAVDMLLGLANGGMSGVPGRGIGRRRTCVRVRASAMA